MQDKNINENKAKKQDKKKENPINVNCIAMNLLI